MPSSPSALNVSQQSGTFPIDQLFASGDQNTGASPLAGDTSVKNPPASAGDIRDTGSVPGLGRSPGGGHDKPLLYSCLENPMGRGSWWAAVHKVTKSD